MPRFDTLHDLLDANARDDRQLTFIDAHDEQRVRSFARLRLRARAALGALNRQGLRAGDVAVLCPADNERFVELFWACVLGGIVPAPLAPPVTDAQRRKLLRVFAQTDAAAVFIDAPALARLDAFAAAAGLAAEADRLRARAVLAGGLDLAGAAGEPVRQSPGDLAFIQYSSGSTGDPKGVLLTHRNLTANIASIAQAAAFTARDAALSWMPLSHDMGLVGFHLNMLACGVNHALMRTELFARRPLLWLELASALRSTVLCSPNFGYQHYLRQYEARPPRALDLSCVRLVFNGAEPVSASLCRRFTDTMARHGLAANAMFAVYGLAEASLAVSFPVPGAPLSTVTVQRSSLQPGQPVLRHEGATAKEAVELVRLGRAVPDSEVRIVCGNTTPLGEYILGNVQIRGANVSAGYHREPAADDRHCAGDGWADTGDLGFWSDGQLVIAGRTKELIIVNGQNYYPDDLERIAAQAVGIELNRVVAAGTRCPDDEADALVLFVQHRGSLSELEAKAIELRRAIGEGVGLEVACVVPVSQIPKTSSGKLQRYALARAFEKGEFDGVLKESAALRLREREVAASVRGSTDTLDRLLAVCAEVIADRTLEPQTNLLEINLSSLTLARVHEAIEREFPQRIDVSDLFDYPTLEQLSERLDTVGH